MANELTVHLSFSYEKDGTTVAKDFGYRRYDVSGTAITHQRFTVGTSEEAIPLGDAGVGGWLFIENRDDANFVRVRPATAEKDVPEIKAGEVQAFRLQADEAAPFIIADTAACEVEFWLFPA